MKILFSSIMKAKHDSVSSMYGFISCRNEIFSCHSTMLTRIFKYRHHHYFKISIFTKIVVRYAARLHDLQKVSPALMPLRWPSAFWSIIITP